MSLSSYPNNFGRLGAVFAGKVWWWRCAVLKDDFGEKSIYAADKLCSETTRRRAGRHRATGSGSAVRMAGRLNGFLVLAFPRKEDIMKSVNNGSSHFTPFLAKMSTSFQASVP